MDLHDGVSKVNKIAVVLLFRNNADYIAHFSKLCADMERVYTCQFEYYIYENDSCDDTVSLLKEFMKHRQGRLWSESLNNQHISDGTTFTRIQRMVYIRNKLLDLSREYITKCDWCLFIDSDIYFDTGDLGTMFRLSPRLNNIVMLTCNTLDLYRRNSTDALVPLHVNFVTECHYYDTFAYVSIDDKHLYPACNNPQCRHITCEKIHNGMQLSKLADIEMVRSAWAGFVLIQSNIFSHPGISWKALCIRGNESLCEHIHFCDSVRCITQGQIVRLNDITLFRKNES